MKIGNECYYKSLSACGCPSAPYENKACVGKDICPNYVSENDYFSMMMSGTLPEAETLQEDPKVRQARIYKNLSLGKSKKQLKYEQQRKDEKNGLPNGDGFRLGDDPKIKEMLNKFGKK